VGCGVEIRDQMLAQTGAPPDQIVVCCGGGGLASGVVLSNRDAEIVVVEPEGWDDMRRSLECGKIVPVGDDPPATDCDALQTLKVAPITFDILRARGVRGIAVTLKFITRCGSRLKNCIWWLSRAVQWRWLQFSLEKSK